MDGAVADEAYVDPPLGPSVESVTNPDGDTQRTPESERTMSHDTEDWLWKKVPTFLPV